MTDTAEQYTHGMGGKWILGQHIPSSRHTVILPLAGYAGLAVGTIASLLFADLGRYLSPVAAAGIGILIAGYWMAKRVPRPILATQKDVNRQFLGWIGFYLAPVFTFIYVSVVTIAYGAEAGWARTWVDLTEPLAVAMKLFIPSLTYYEEELAAMSLQARNPLLQHAFAVGWAAQMAGLCALFRVPATWWVSRGDPISRRRMRNRCIAVLPVMSVLSWIIYVCLTGWAFNLSDNTRALANISHHSNAHLGVQAVVQPFLFGAAYWFFILFVVDLMRNDEHKVAESVSNPGKVEP